MPAIEITEDQQEYLEDLRAELEADIVGPYGHVRIGDAVQYLIDNHDGTLDDVLAEEAADVTKSDDSRDVDADTEESEDTSEESEDDDAEESGDDDAEKSEDDDADEPEDDDADDDQSGEDRLSAMMSLLDTHDEKWRETSGDARYEVDLPDGTSEDAPTKDDVRALLFKNY
ncbi:hypothetical protein ACFQH2_06980 [Natronoarchaeum sp. GCM10025703]|uniref:hypothetical protein n=1 Tax=unclassified Natronoarchaeum TaxID=2620183 RepID=UPI00361B6041